MAEDAKKSGGSGIDKILGSISPLYGAISGQGLFSPLRYTSPVLMAVDALKKKKKDGTTVTGEAVEETTMRRGGKVKKMAKGGSASSRADGIARKGKTRGKMC